MEFATLDFETTGLSPAYHHRVIEIGIVRTTEQGDVIAEYSSLVNPERDLGRQDIHGIQSWEVLSAPLFRDIAADIFDHLDGAVLIAHNAAFERQFLVSEMRRIGLETAVEIDCTIALLHDRSPDAPRQLSKACRALGVSLEAAHEALGDARMASRLFHCLHGQQVANWSSNPFQAPRIDQPSAPPAPRGTGQSVTATQATGLAQLLERLPGGAPVTARTSEGAQYLALLETALEDRRLDAQEADELLAVARGCGLGAEDVRALHKEFVTQLAAVALADNVVSQQEADDLDAVATILGVEEWDRILLSIRRGGGSSGRTLSDHEMDKPQAFSPGTTICFTGQMEWGRREDFEALAISNGLEVRPAISRQVDVLIIADPDSQSGKAKKARDLGIRIVSEARFLHLMGNPPPPRS